MKILQPVTDRLTLNQLRVAVHLAGIAGVGVIVGFAYFLCFHSTDDQIAEWSANLESDRQVIALGDAIIISREDTECELYAMQQRLEELTALIPNRPEESRFLAQLSDLSRESKLEINNFRPGPAEDSENVRRMRIKLSGEGSYRCICEFLDGLRTLPRLTHVSELKVDPPKQDGTYPVMMELSIFFAAESPVTKVARK